MKKIIKKVKKAKVGIEEVQVPTTWIMPDAIGLLSASFGQEDLNKMVDKINEIILRLNNMV